ncbi:hypothetical protein SAMN04487948_103481 [Halogranum amylolyticum]|uniref:Uncharacterized protein n=1 Tax=Halogranum amylolyticum TaxID=660520 RepID=A0A1H8R4H1_9EURY|nr:hypothetical protein [Halogranum amylolyticum]SEO61038.1 hypothetical protein SAMN04487948_103481 [Halogranum amylolyticum]
MREVQSCDFCGDDAVGTFEVVPDDLFSSDTDQRRVALCDHCRTTLEGVLEPFIRRDADAVVNDEAADAEPTVSTTEADETGADDADRSSTSAAVDPTARAEGIAIGREGDSETVEGGETDESDPLSTDDGVGVVDEDADEASEIGEEPDQFRTVMRLLSNREFPVDRAAFEELTAGAYELEDEHVARIVDHAVDRGVVVDDAGTLKKR